MHSCVILLVARMCFYFGGFMAKLNVTVDNDLDNVKLESLDKIKSKKKKETNKSTNKKSNDKENYTKGVIEEMKKVTWPSKKSVVKYSIATIIMILFLSAFFIGLSALFDLLYRLVQGWLS